MQQEPIEKDELLAKWKSKVGDTFADSVSIDLLAVGISKLYCSSFHLKFLKGNYIETEVFGGSITTLKYFPASELPVDPAARFADLFLTRSKWKGEEISPFLSDIAANSKERDKLLLKYCRTVTEPGGVRYTARAQYNG